MSVFPVELPKLTELRPSAEASLARNVGLLSGIADPAGGLSWVCEYDEITLRDLARGAPQSGPPSRLPAKMPSPLMPSTMNTFKPDTKAAAFLAGSNHLLGDFAASFREALEVVDAANRTPGEKPALEPVVMLAFWAAGVLSGYRSYPLLFVSALKARAIQRVLANGWIVVTPPDLEAAPSEYGGHPPRASTPRSPSHLDALDRTLETLDAWLRVDLSPDIRSLTDSIANAMGRLLLRIGGRHEGEPAIVWSYDTRPGRRAVDVFLPPMRVMKSFIGEQSGARLPRPEAVEPGKRLPDPPSGSVVPLLPDAATWAGMPANQRKLLVEMYSLVLRWLRDDDVYGEEREVGLAALDAHRQLDLIAEKYLPSDDTVRLDCAIATEIGVIRGSIRGQDGVRYRRAIDLNAIVRTRLETASDDVGMLLDMLSRSAAGLNRARRGAASRVDREVLEPALHEAWRSFNAALDARVQRVPGASALGWHLHSYAGFLGTLHDVGSLRESVELFRRYVIPSRYEAYRASPRGNMLRFSLQVGARSAASLAGKLDGAAFREEARDTGELALAWAVEAIRTDDARLILDDGRTPVEGNVLFASAVVGAFAAASSLGLAIDASWLPSLEQAVRRSHEWIAGDKRGDDRVAEDAVLDAQLELIRVAARG